MSVNVPTKYLQDVNRAPKVEVLPDFRLRVSRRLDIADQQAVLKTSDLFITNAEIEWGTMDADYPQCRLVAQDTPGQVENPNKSPNDPPAYIIRVFEEIPENDRVIVGLPAISYDQYGRKSVVIDYIAFSAGTTDYADTVGSSPAPAPNAECILKTDEGTNNGTVRTWKLTYIDSGELSDNTELKFDGKLKLRTLTYLNEIPPAPSGYNFVGLSTEFIEGLPVYRAQYAAVAGSGGTTSGPISQGVEYFYSPDVGTTGITRYTISQLSDPSVSSNPITAPAGTVLVSATYTDNDGYRTWAAVYAKGTGLISDETETHQGGKLIIYKRTAINAAPATPSATIGGTVTLVDDTIDNGTRIEDGTVIYRRVWSEANGTVDNDNAGDNDGSIVYRVTTLTAGATTPAYPGAGTAYLINLKNEARDGYFMNVATYKKPPVTVTYKKQISYPWPGVASFTGSPPQYVQEPPGDRTLLADVEVSFDTSQITTLPFEVEAYAALYVNYTPTANGIPVSYQKGLGGYLAGASSISGTADYFNGVLCDTYSAVLVSSIPSTLPTGLTVLHIDNDPYLTAIDGTMVFRRSKTTYSF